MGVFLSADEITSTYLLLEAKKNNSAALPLKRLYPVLLHFWYLNLLS